MTKTTSDISPATVQRVIKMRAKGKTWIEIVTMLDKPRNFILRIRPLMKKMDRNSVAKRGL